MALELIALVLLQQKPAIRYVGKFLDLTYTYNVEVKAYEPQWKFTLNFVLKETVSFQGHPGIESPKYRASNFMMRSETKDEAPAVLSAVLELPAKELNQVMATDRSFVIWFLSGGSLMGINPTFSVASMPGPIPPKITIFGREYAVSSEPGFPTPQPKEANRMSGTFNLVDQVLPESSFLVTLDRKWDKEGKTIHADVSISGKGNQRVTLQIQRVPNTPLRGLLNPHPLQHPVRGAVC